MKKVEAICIDAKNKPAIIPDALWVKEQAPYTITHVWDMAERDKNDEVITTGIKGCDIAEHDISAYIPYNCYRLDRFAFTPENLLKLQDLMRDCTSLNDADISSLTDILKILDEEAVEVQEVEYA